MGILDNLVEELRKTKLDTDLINEIKQCVNEELGINNDVVQASYRIIEELKEDMKNVPKMYFSNIDVASHKLGRFKTNAFGNEINVTYRITNFRDKYYYDLGRDKVTHYPNGFDYKNMTLMVDILSISGKIDEKTCSDTIQHELEHLFQEIKRDKSFGEDELYKMANFLKTYYRNDPTAYKIGDLIYFSRQCENDAYVNGLYALLVDNYKNHHWPTASVIQGSDLYAGLKRMKENKQWLEQNKETEQVKELFKSINRNVSITPEKLLKFVEKSEKRLMNKTGKVIVKVQKDCGVNNDLENTWWK